MSDRIFRMAGDPPTDLKVHDNGDGTFSLAVYGAGGAGLTDAQLRASAVPVVGGAGEAHLGAVGGDPPPTLTATPTISTSAYSANMCVGGKLTFANAVRVAGGSSILQSIFLIDRANQKAPLSILFFNADPSTSTLADHAQPTFTAADISALIRRVEIAASDWVTTDHAGTDFATADISAIAKLLKPASGTSLYAVIITTGTPTYTALALTLNVGALYAS